jgi:hypothetical protein
MKVAQTAVAMILGIVLPLLVQLWDKRRLSNEERARSWTVATWGSALYAFGPLSMLGWSFVTRRGWSRFVAGPLWMAAIVVTMSLVDHGLALLGGGEVEGTLLELVVAVPFVVVGGVIIQLLAALISWRARVWRHRIARVRRWLAPKGSPA